MEFYNEPDLALGTSLNAQQYQDYLFVRSLSIQNAYADLNVDFPKNPMPANVVASAFARGTYGGDPTQYLGDMTVPFNNVT
jgi:hypothetical protein